MNIYLSALVVVILLGAFTFLKSKLDLGDEGRDKGEKGESDDYKHYVKKNFLMSKAEHEFYKVLREAVKDKYYIVPQVQLSKIVEVNHYEHQKRKYFNKIDRKSVDFVLFDKENFSPEIVVELDDTSHLLPDRESRDDFVNSILDRTGIKVVHIKTAYHYNLNEIEKMLNNTPKKVIRILHTDDDQFILDLYKPLFEKEGYRVTNLKTLDRDFIQQIIKITPDLIISDITKSDISGIEFLRALKANERTKNIPFVFLTNSEGQEIKDEAKKLGVMIYLVKAEMKPNEVVNKVNILVRNCGDSLVCF